MANQPQQSRIVGQITQCKLHNLYCSDIVNIFNLLSLLNAKPVSLGNHHAACGCFHLLKFQAN